MKMKTSQWTRTAIAIFTVIAVSLPAAAQEDTRAKILAEFPDKPLDDRQLLRHFSTELGTIVDDCEIPSAEQIDKSIVELDGKDLRAKVGKVSIDSSGPELKPFEVYQKHIDATLIFGSVYKCGRCSKWHSGSTASAWVLDRDGIVVSNYHVVEDKKTDRFFGVSTRDGEVFPVVEVLAANKDADIAVFRVDTVGKKLKSALKLGPQPEIGKDVVVLSNPKRRFFTLSKGYVSRNYMMIPGRDKAKVPQMTITADYAVGSSGGPVLDLHGNVVGMVRSTQTVVVNGSSEDDAHKVQMVFKDCVPVAAIRAMLDEAKN